MKGSCTNHWAKITLCWTLRHWPQASLAGLLGSTWLLSHVCCGQEKLKQWFTIQGCDCYKQGLKPEKYPNWLVQKQCLKCWFGGYFCRINVIWKTGGQLYCSYLEGLLFFSIIRPFMGFKESFVSQREEEKRNPALLILGFLSSYKSVKIKWKKRLLSNVQGWNGLSELTELIL